MRTINRLLKILGVAVVMLAVWDQVVRDSAYRDWHGQILGLPYDFRLPTVSRMQDALWSPGAERLLSPHVFGVGWSPNFGRIYALLSRRRGVG